MQKRSLKIIKAYLLALICILCFFLLNHSNIIPKLVTQADIGRYKGFVTFLLIGLFKYGLLVIGIGLIMILSILLILNNKRSHENRTHL